MVFKKRKYVWQPFIDPVQAVEDNKELIEELLGGFKKAKGRTMDKEMEKLRDEVIMGSASALEKHGIKMGWNDCYEIMEEELNISDNKLAVEMAKNAKLVEALKGIDSEITRGTTKDCLGCLNGRDIPKEELCRSCWRLYFKGEMYLLWDWKVTKKRIIRALKENHE